MEKQKTFLKTKKFYLQYILRYGRFCYFIICFIIKIECVYLFVEFLASQYIGTFVHVLQNNIWTTQFYEFHIRHDITICNDWYNQHRDQHYTCFILARKNQNFTVNIYLSNLCVWELIPSYNSMSIKRVYNVKKIVLINSFNICRYKCVLYNVKNLT